MTAKPLMAFQARLADVGDLTEERNRTRRPYTAPAASVVPQSINV